MLMEALVHKKKKLVLISKANTKFWLSLHYNANSSYLLVNPTIKMLIFQHNFGWEVWI